MPQKVLILLFSLIIAMILVEPISADGPSPDYVCKKCHVGADEELILPSGETVKLGVDVGELSQSVHGSHISESEEQVYCTDCHRSRTRYLYPHQPNPAQSREEFAADVSQSCDRCHDSLQKHNPGHLMAENTANLPVCTACHVGGHVMESADLLAENSVATCQNCHQTYDDPKIEELHHDVVDNLGLDQTCQTCHTDAPTYPADQPCKTCHGLLTNALILDSDEALSLNVNVDLLNESVHGENLTEKHGYMPMMCTNCHRDQEQYTFPHSASSASNAREFTVKKSEICQDCHKSIHEKQKDSIHTIALAQDNLDTATCVDCHGNHNIQVPNEPREHISQMCSKCHDDINDEYASSVHGAALLGEDNPDVPVCIDCHGVHNISDPTTAKFRIDSPLLCAECHADEELMDEYDISPNVFETYVADFHGTTLQLFEPNPDTPPRQAVCFDCHGIHAIHAIDDPEAGLGIRENLLVTCQKCHEEATLNFPDAWLAHYEPSPEETWVVYYTEIFFVTLTSMVMIGLISHIGLDFLRLIINKAKGASHEKSS
ncbi:hypothetical protein QUF58_13595 [Anaerolineales bacterium HSG24]|nr:hypothetical protein [Anaerolineales bacterium HSG24]